MRVTVNWADATHNALHFRFIDPWHWDHYNSAVRSARTLADSADHTYDVILDFTQAHRGIPFGGLDHVRGSLENAHALRGVVVIVGANAFVRNFIRLVERVSPGEIGIHSYADTLDEAHAHLRTVRQQRAALGVAI